MPKIDVLKLDKDCHVDEVWTKDYVECVILPVCEIFGLTVETIETCKSKSKGMHYYIIISPSVDAETANRLQYLLGDDCQRVDFNRARIESGLQEWNKLFEIEGRKLKTIYRKNKNDQKIYPG